MSKFHSFLRIVGSLKLASILLVLLSVAMACATVFEATPGKGTAQALALFYKSWWFEGLFYLLGVNVLASAVLRYPFTRRHIGFLVTHGSLLLILLGAWTTKHWAIEGQVALQEGKTTDVFADSYVETLSLSTRGQDNATTDRAEVNLNGIGGFEPLTLDGSLAVTLKDARARVLAYLPETLRDDHVAALQLAVTGTGDEDRFWLRKNERRNVLIDGTPYQISYGDRVLPLGFVIGLDRFAIGYYPGTHRPRSFESRVILGDAGGGGEQARTISMNHPVTRNGYTLFQSSYEMGEAGKPSTTFLSVSRDPGQPIVFAGYIALMLGMLYVLVAHMWEKRRKSGLAIEGAEPVAGKQEKKR